MAVDVDQVVYVKTSFTAVHVVTSYSKDVDISFNMVDVAEQEVEIVDI